MNDARWVFDTNTLVSRLLMPRGTAAQAVDRGLNSGVLLVSDETMQELANVLARPKFDPYLTIAERQQFIRLLGGIARIIPITRCFKVCRDPKDNKFLDVAMNGQAHGITTGDKDLLVLHPFHDIPVLSLRDFITWQDTQ